MDHSRIKDTSAAGGEYLLLIEFVHRHLGFHDAELESVLEMSGIKLGVDCQLRPLPNNGTDSKISTNYTRPFKILSFPWSSIGSKFSITSEGDNEEKETKSRINLVSSLARCTLIRSVIELWGSGVTIEDCVKATQQGNCHTRHQIGMHLGETSPKYQDRTWKITIHTLGSTYTREEQNKIKK